MDNSARLFCGAFRKCRQLAKPGLREWEDEESPESPYHTEVEFDFEPGGSDVWQIVAVYDARRGVGKIEAMTRLYGTAGWSWVAVPPRVWKKYEKAIEYEATKRGKAAVSQALRHGTVGEALARVNALLGDGRKLGSRRLAEMTPEDAKEWLKGAPEAGKTAPGLRGMMDGENFYCASCIGRLSARGVLSGSRMTPVWDDKGAPKRKCAACGSKA